jgi:hypothetical protein
MRGSPLNGGVQLGAVQVQVTSQKIVPQANIEPIQPGPANPLAGPAVRVIDMSTGECWWIPCDIGFLRRQAELFRRVADQLDPQRLVPAEDERMAS